MSDFSTQYSEQQVLNRSFDATNNRLNVSTAPLTATDVVSVVNKPITTSTPTSISSSASSTQLLAANSNRRAVSIFNDSTQVLYVKFGTTASTTDFKVKINPQGYFEFPLPIYTGRVDGIWAAANGSARITEDV